MLRRARAWTGCWAGRSKNLRKAARLRAESAFPVALQHDLPTSWAGDAAPVRTRREGQGIRPGRRRGDAEPCLCLHGAEAWHPDACQRRPEVLGDFREWKNEVLTGMDSKGAPSAIDNAVLPGVRSAPVCDVTPEDIIARQQMNVRLKQRTARDLGLTADEFEKYMIEGRIQICNGPKKSMPPHPGVFNRDREGWKAVCRRCQAAERRRNRK